MNLLWLDIYSGKYKTFLDLLKNPKWLTLVFTPNPEILVRASRDKEFLDILGKATYLTPDAHGLYVWAEIVKGRGYISSLIRVLFSKQKIIKKYGELIKGSDLTRDLFAYAETSWKAILMIDNYRITEPRNDFEKRKMEIQKSLLTLLKERYPDLSIHVFFDHEMSPDAIAHFIEINHIDYVFSCIGMKEQEKRLIEIFSYLSDTKPIVWVWVGSSVDYLLGLQTRAPMIIQKLWLEWLYRLILDPKRRWKRIYDALIVFPKLLKNH